MQPLPPFLPHQFPSIHRLKLMAAKSNLQAFLAGSALTASLFYIYQKTQSSSPHKSTQNRQTGQIQHVGQSSRRNTADNSSQLMDSAALDQRMIRVSSVHNEASEPEVPAEAEPLSIILISKKLSTRLSLTNLIPSYQLSTFA